MSTIKKSASVTIDDGTTRIYLTFELEGQTLSAWFKQVCKKCEPLLADGQKLSSIYFYTTEDLQ